MLVILDNKVAHTSMWLTVVLPYPAQILFCFSQLPLDEILDLSDFCTLEKYEYIVWTAPAETAEANLVQSILYIILT